MTESVRQPKKRAILYIILSILTGATAIVGYIFNIHILFGFTGESIINPLTSIGLTLIGLWLLFIHYKYEVGLKFKYAVCTFIFLIAINKITDYLGLTSFHLHQYFLQNIEYENSNLIAPNSTIILICCSFLILVINSKNRIILLLRDLILLGCFLNCYIVIIGYIYHIEIAYTMGWFVPMAFNTAVGYLFILVSIAYEGTAGKTLQVIGSRYAGGSLARKAIPTILIIPVILGYLRLWGERNILYGSVYGVALETGAMVLLVLCVIYFYASHLNLEDKKRRLAELAILESERKFRTLVSAMREGVVYYTVDGTIQYINKSFTEITGYDENDVLGKNIFNLFATENIQEKYKQLQQKKNHYKSEVLEEPFVTKQGKSIWLSISSRLIDEEQNEAQAILSTIEDCTERKQYLEDLNAFNACAAHDLSSPLARIEMICNLITDNELDLSVEEKLAYNKDILEIATNMRVLLKELLNFSKIGICEVNKSSCDLNELVLNAIKATKFINPKAVISISKLPTCEVDPVLLQQVFTNLIGNAMKYSSNNAEPKVEISHQNNTDHYLIIIKDNGIGFNMEQNSKLFTPFQRLTNKFEGHGLGLPIVKRILEKHGSEIWALSEKKKGATFFFTMKK